MKIKFLLVALASLLVALAAAGGIYLFRTSEVTNPIFGEFHFKWRWGLAREMGVDVDRDGRIDFRALYTDRARVFSTHRAQSEWWLSRRCDGRFDVHFSAREPSTLYVDTDLDGTFEGSSSLEELRASLKVEDSFACWRSAIQLLDS